MDPHITEWVERLSAEHMIVGVAWVGAHHFTLFG